MLQRVPDGSVGPFKNLKLDSQFVFSDYLNPFHIESDFNYDNEPDIAFAIEQKSSKKTGALITNYLFDFGYVFGYHHDLGNGGVNFERMDTWKVHRGIDPAELRSDPNPVFNCRLKQKIMITGFEVIKSERTEEV